MRRILWLAGLLLAAVLIGRGMSPEARRSFEQLKGRAAEGNAEAMWRLSRVYETGYDSIPADTVRWLSLLRGAAQRGNPAAANYLGYIYGEGRGVTQNPDSARYWISRAADAGDARAAANMAFMLVHRDSDHQRALPYLEKAAQGGVPTALSLLADLHREGKGVERDTAAAASLYESAANAGLEDADLRLLNMMGRSWQRLPAEEAATLGKNFYSENLPVSGAFLMELGGDDPETLRLLGEAYALGRGKPYNYEKAMEYYRRAAAAGDSKAIQIIRETEEIFPDRK